MSPLRRLILQRLEENQILTKVLCSKLFPWTVDKNDPNQEPTIRVYQPNPRRKVWYLRSYVNAQDVLNRLLADGEVKRLEQRKNDSDLWMLADVRKKPIKRNESPARMNQLTHDLGVAEISAVLTPHTHEDDSPIIETWDRSESTPEFQSLRFDVDTKMYGHQFYIERECGTHPVLLTDERIKAADPAYYKDTVNYKIDRIVEYSNRHHDKRFTYLFTVEVMDGDFYDLKATTKLRDDIITLLSTYARGDQFVVAFHRHVVGNKDEIPGEVHNEVMGHPLGAVWLSPLRDASGKYRWLSLKDLAAPKRTP